MTAQIIQGSVFDVLPTLKPGSVDCCVTSPPYWMLRSYLPKGHALKPLELGSEPTPTAFVANMVRVFSLVREAMADHAVCFLNMGDTYCNAGSRNNGTGLDGKRRGGMQNTNGTWADAKESHPDIRRTIGVDVGSLCLIPQRLAIALQDDGWLVRSVIVWHKPSAMPASLAGWRWMRHRVKVKGQKLKTDSRTHTLEGGMANGKPHTINPDWLAEWSDCPGCAKCTPHDGYVLRRGSWRPTSAWEPILLLAKSAGYFADGESVKTPVDRVVKHQPSQLRSELLNEGPMNRGEDNPQFEYGREWGDMGGANLRDVWTIAAEPLKEKHYAAFPGELVRRCLKAGTSAKGYCPTCSAPWVRVVESRRVGDGKVCPSDEGSWESRRAGQGRGLDDDPVNTTGLHSQYFEKESQTIGWRPSCRCPGDLPPRPGVVLDPFCGSGRTLLNAQRLGLDGIGCELNPEYVEMAARLLFEDSPLFAQVED